MKNNKIMNKKSRLLITIVAIAIIIIAAFSTIFKDDIPAVYYSVFYGKNINIGENQLTLDDAFFFLSDNKDIKNIGVSSKAFINRTPIVVILPNRISIPKMVEHGKLIYKSDVLEYCKLYKFDDAEEFILFNQRKNIGYSINKEYKLLSDQESICNILN
jgi:hypothetical protein